MKRNLIIIEIIKVDRKIEETITMIKIKFLIEEINKKIIIMTKKGKIFKENKIKNTKKLNKKEKIIKKVIVKIEKIMIIKENNIIKKKKIPKFN